MIPEDSITQADSRAHTRLQKVEQELDNLLYSISHDMRTPLRSINGFAEALREDYAGKLDATGEDYLQRIGAGARTLDRMLAGVVQLSRISRCVCTPVHVDISATCEDILNGHQEESPLPRVTRQVTPGMDLCTDRNLLRGVLGALIDNAWKFSAHRAPPSISIDITRAAHHGLEIEIRDNGVGFDMGIAGTRIFTLFQRFHAPDDFPGVGVGLALALRGAHKLGGSIRCQSIPGQGSTFTLSLPAKIPPDEL